MKNKIFDTQGNITPFLTQFASNGDPKLFERAHQFGLKRDISDEELSQINKVGFTVVITDAEGKERKVSESLIRSLHIIRGICQQKKLNYEDIKIKLLDLGDPTDKGPNNINILKQLNYYKENFGMQTIISNRYANKFRFKEALSSQLRNKFNTLDKPYHYWAASNALTPSQWLKNKRPGLEYNSISEAEKIMIILEFICQETMGAPSYTQDLKKEIKDTYEIDLTPVELIHFIYQFHFSKQQYNEFKHRLPELDQPSIDRLSTLSETIALFHDYHADATMGLVDQQQLYMHSRSQVFPYMQSGQYPNPFLVTHRAKFFSALSLINLVMSISLLSIATSPCILVTFGMCLSLLAFCLCAYKAFEALNTNQYARWLDARTQEFKDDLNHYLQLTPEDLFNNFEDDQSAFCLKEHPYVNAALPFNQNLDYAKHLIISTNSAQYSADNPEYLDKLINNNIRHVITGHQPLNAGGGQLDIIKHIKNNNDTDTHEIHFSDLDYGDQLMGGGVLIGNMARVLQVESYKNQDSNEIIYVGTDSTLNYNHVCQEDQKKITRSIGTKIDEDHQTLYAQYNVGTFFDGRLARFPGDGTDNIAPSNGARG